MKYCVKRDGENWERVACRHYRHLIDMIDICVDTMDIYEEMRKYISSSSRLDRNKILSYIKEIEDKVE